MNEKTLLMIVFAFVLFIAMAWFAPQLGLYTMHVINQIKNWFKIILNSIISSSPLGGAQNWI